jgi:hypothetical protein
MGNAQQFFHSIHHSEEENLFVNYLVALAGISNLISRK